MKSEKQEISDKHEASDSSHSFHIDKHEYLIKCTRKKDTNNIKFSRWSQQRTIGNVSRVELKVWSRSQRTYVIYQ